MESNKFKVTLEVTKEVPRTSEGISNAIAEQNEILKKGFLTVDGIDYKIKESIITEKRSDLILMIIELDASSFKVEV
ncbi:MAG: hypothetical protein ACRCXX_14335 [Cetobacterium sp.]|uniref:hypothetical protein n=1 Tax=Cetobacterium sp. TaxID=2071632 RepID=UPI003F325F03